MPANELVGDKLPAENARDLRPAAASLRRGQIRILNRHAIAIVGTRRPTPYGNQITERLARDLADRGLLILSGLARGIDSSAHRGACSSPRGITVGVLGCGVDVVYPKENRKLFAEVEKRDAVIQRIPSGHAPWPGKFPGAQPDCCGHGPRSGGGASCAYSGSLITSGIGMEFGGEVFGVPGNVTEPSSFAPHQLIKQGAKLVTGWEDVVEELPTEDSPSFFRSKQPRRGPGVFVRAGPFAGREEALRPGRKVIQSACSRRSSRERSPNLLALPMSRRRFNARSSASWNTAKLAST